MLPSVIAIRWASGSWSGRGLLPGRVVESVADIAALLSLLGYRVDTSAVSGVGAIGIEPKVE
jgi:hypothetical protein